MNPSGETIFVRPMEERDEAAVDALHREAQQESESYRGEVPAPASRVRGAGAIHLVAGVGSTVFGTISLSQVTDREWWLDIVHVDARARGVGIGDALLREALSQVRDKGAAKIRAGAQPGDRSLKNLFERHGLVARTIIVGRDL